MVEIKKRLCWRDLEVKIREIQKQTFSSFKTQTHFFHSIKTMHFSMNQKSIIYNL
jgi:hypothetical protein